MIKPKAIIVSVDYADILAMTLPYNRDFFSEVLIVTTAEDTATMEIAKANDAKVYCTDAFYRRNAYFNKFLALEEGLDILGRDGWLLILDADIVIPQQRPMFIPQQGKIYTPHRRIKLEIACGIPEQRRWSQYKRTKANEEFAGYFQLFHASDRALGPVPWHSVQWTWAGGADTAFHNQWMPMNKVRPPFEVLHLGAPFRNWCGRTEAYSDGRIDPKAQERTEHREMLLKSRRTAGPLDRFFKEKLQ